MATILDEIVRDKRVEIARRRRDLPVDALRERAIETPRPPDLIAALKKAPIGLIAEAKRRSPSAGPIREPFDAGGIVRDYERAGAQACSVLVDAAYFGGGDEAFRAAREAVSLPLLYKEFVIDPWQVWHARHLGASAVLLISGVLDTGQLASMGALCRDAGMAALVEVHDEDQMQMARAAGAEFVGINNRDLKTFTVSLETTFRLMKTAPDGCTVVSESGISSAEDVLRLKAAGIDSVLVGEHLLRQEDLQEAVRDLMGKAWTSS